MEEIIEEKANNINIERKDAIIFCRVSSIGQTGSMHISFEVQERQGNNCANYFSLKVYSVIKVVESAYDGKKSTIKSLINKSRGKNIIIYNVSRFSRNKNSGVSLLYHALKNKVRFFFVEEGIIWDENHRDNLQKITRKLEYSEEESRQLGKRIKDALAEKKRRGYFTGSIAKYGYKTVSYLEGKKLINEDYEQEVIKFINMCKTVGTKILDLNKQMRIISPDYDEPILFFYNDIAVLELKDPLTNVNIASLLNSYNVTKRGNNWNSSSVSSISRQDYRENYNVVVENLENIGFGFE